ncbi:fibrinogen C domain-containing protein 1-like isoform X3 [Liolophura sinensis]|uniref:fibrinogen C domain-containing protein 1-like isoform X3 n=1 Tax=Liolophura sinensis TaxID=3198878 RepID=UPI00315811B0
MGISYRVLLALLAVVVSYPKTGAAYSYGQFLNQFEVLPLGNESLKDTCSTSEPHMFDGCIYPSDCADVHKCDHTKSGVYRVFPFGVGSGFLVYCDMVTNGGGWLVFQRRQDGSVDFTRMWQEYKDGFGNLCQEFWLGLEKLHLLTSQRHYELMINIANYSGNSFHATYSRFCISGERQKFRLMLGSYSGTAEDSMTYHNGYQFSTPDSDNDALPTGHCAEEYKAGWWYSGCHRSNLNGEYVYVGGKPRKKYSGIAGVYWLENYGHLQYAEMKIRPVGKS